MKKNSIHSTGKKYVTLRCPLITVHLPSSLTLGRLSLRSYNNIWCWPLKGNHLLFKLASWSNGTCVNITTYAKSWKNPKNVKSTSIFALLTTRKSLILSIMWRALENVGVPTYQVKWMQLMYTDHETTV